MSEPVAATVPVSVAVPVAATVALSVSVSEPVAASVSVSMSEPVAASVSVSELVPEPVTATLSVSEPMAVPVTVTLPVTVPSPSVPSRAELFRPPPFLSSRAERPQAAKSRDLPGGSLAFGAPCAAWGGELPHPLARLPRSG